MLFFKLLKFGMEMDEGVLKLARGLEKGYSGLIVSVVLVGSYVEGRRGGDLDLVVVYDDLALRERGLDEDGFESELEDFVDELARRIGFGGVKRRGGVVRGERVDLFAVSLSRFWSLLEERSPHILSYLEDGVPLVDEGFFKYLQRLYRLGVFKPDEKAAWDLFERASKRALQAKTVKLLLVADDCYNAIVGSAMALLMREGVKVNPNNVYEEFVKRFVDTGLFDGEMAGWIREIRDLRKKIERGEVRDLEGGDIDRWIERADKFVSRVYELLKRGVERKT